MLWWWYTDDATSTAATARCFTPLVPRSLHHFHRWTSRRVLLLACFLKIGRKWTCLDPRKMHQGRASKFSLLGTAPRRRREWEDEDRRRPAVGSFVAHLPSTSLPLHFLFPSLPSLPLLPLTLCFEKRKKMADFVTVEKCMSWQGVSHCFYVTCLSPPRQANKDPLFLTGVTFPSEYPASPETLVKLSVYDSKDKSQESVSTQFHVPASVHVARFHILGREKRCVFLCQRIQIGKWSEARFSFVHASNVGNIVLGFWLYRGSRWKAVKNLLQDLMLLALIFLFQRCTGKCVL